MFKSVLTLFLLAAATFATPPAPGPGTKSLFDGKSISGWEGNARLWCVEDGALTGGSLTEMVKHNDFLATVRDYTNFIVRMQIKLTGAEGFINSGFQIRSQRVPNNSEMAGYQCDYGDPNWWGAIYDESRRNRVISASDMGALGPVIKRNDWNEYVIRADGPRITTWINGVQATDYFEPDSDIPDFGKMGIQVHGGGKALVQVKEITVEELPSTAAGKRFIGAPTPKKSAHAEPLSPDEEKAAFTVSPGFEIELVAAESDGIGKFVAIDWDIHGRMWSMTALEYPVDANETPEVAKALYASRAKDKVLVWDQPYGPGPHQPRVFAEGLAIPLGILPYKNGVYVQHGPDIAFLVDTNNDGRSDQRQTILTGFGVQDSHLFPHQFTRGPENWIWFAQGAFNYGKVRTTRGVEQQFDRTRMARFRYDGSDFEITSQGPCNIWGLVLTDEGEAWIQEANDYGYPAMPFHEYANYPGCSNPEWKSYAPEFPGTAPDFQMGGTGLSGLALSDKTLWPEPYNDVMYVANPITRKIQAIKIHRDGGRYKLQKLPDFIQSSDEMFRPVALRMGPDGCMYIVDWYNKIISHNEVPRAHPERDKKRGRIWRVKATGRKPLEVPDFAKLSPEELVAKLGGESVTQTHLAWQAIVDRQLSVLVPQMKAIVTNKSESPGRRVTALWAIEGLDGPDVFNKGAQYLELLSPLLTDSHRNIRRQAVRVLGARPLSVANASGSWNKLFDSLDAFANDPEPEVRAEVIKTTARFLRIFQLSSDSRTTSLSSERALPLLVRMAKPSLPGPTARSTHHGRAIKVGEAYDREFERYLVRLLLESHSADVSAFLDSPAARQLPTENLLVAALALDPIASAQRVARLMAQIDRPPGEEEVLRLAQHLDQPGVGAALQGALQNRAARDSVLEALLKVRSRLDASRLTPLLEESARALWRADASARLLALRLTSAFKLTGMEEPIYSSLPEAKDAELVPALKALRELGPARIEELVKLAKHPRREVADEAVMALASVRTPQGATTIFDNLWEDLAAPQRRSVLELLSGTKAGANAILAAVDSSKLPKADLDAATLDKLHAVMGDHPGLAKLLEELAPLFRPALRLDGRNESYVDSNITLSNAFTVETWVRLDEGISNDDGILGAPGSADLNFFDGTFRFYCGPAISDRAVAKKKMAPNAWTHIAVTRDSAGVFRTYINGELDTIDTRAVTNTFSNLDIGRTIPAGGTAGWLSDFRVWNVARSGDQIRAHFDQTFGTKKPPGLVHYYPAFADWPKLHGTAKVTKTADFPPLLTPEEASAQEALFAKFRGSASRAGDINGGKTLFGTICAGCHSVAGQGGQIGPVLNGAGATGMEALLRNVLTPNAAMEAGYRTFRVELKDGDILDGLLVSQDKEAILLRRQNTEDTRIPQSTVRRAGFIHRSVMPEGLLDPLKPEEVADLFTYLNSLR